MKEQNNYNRIEEAVELLLESKKEFKSLFNQSSTNYQFDNVMDVLMNISELAYLHNEGEDEDEDEDE